MKRVLALALVTGVAVSVAGAAQAGPLDAADVVVGTGGDVQVVFLGSSTGGLDTLSLLTAGGSTALFTNQGPNAATIGETIDLGSFAAGQEIVFDLTNARQGTTFTEGLGALNPDGDIHFLVTPDLSAITALCNTSGCLSAASQAAAANLPAGADFVGVEDLAVGQNSDFDYNDIVFAVLGGVDPPAGGDTDLPEPATLAIFGTGLLGLVAVGRRRTRTI